MPFESVEDNHIVLSNLKISKFLRMASSLLYQTASRLPPRSHIAAIIRNLAASSGHI